MKLKCVKENNFKEFSFGESGIVKNGRYYLPSAFPYFEDKDFRAFTDKTFEKRTELLNEVFFGKDEIKPPLNIPEDYEIIKLSDELYSADFTGGEHSVIKDFVPYQGEENGMLRIISYVGIFFSIYADMADGGEIENGEELDYAVPAELPEAVIAGFIAKFCGLKIGKILLCKDGFETFRSAAVFKAESGVISDVINDFYEDYDYLLSPVTAGCVYSWDNCESNSKTVIIDAVSPFIYAREVYAALSGKSEKDFIKAAKKLSFETAGQLPLSIGDAEKIRDEFEKDIISMKVLCNIYSVLKDY